MQASPLTKQITLTILIADLEVPAAFASPLAMPALAAARRRATRRLSAGQCFEEAILSELGGDCDIASATAKLDMPEATLPDGVVWMRADPVHLAVSRDNVQLFDSGVLQPSAAEMSAIANTLNRHFAEDGLSFVFPQPTRGYVQVAAAEAAQSSPLWSVIGGNVFTHMPASPKWRAMLNEVQMLLHTHPVNQQREANGVRAINGLWCWGATSAQQITPPDTPYQSLIGDDIIARAVALQADIPALPLPTANGFDDNFLTTSNTLAVLHQPTAALRALSPADWQSAVTHVDTHWVAAALNALDTKKIAALKIIIANSEYTEMLEVRRLGGLSKIKSWFNAKKLS
jgi:hypothetical protein